MPPLPSDSAPSSTPATGEKLPANAMGMPRNISALLDQKQRLEAALELNAAILTSQSLGREPKLPGLLRMLSWGEGLLVEKGAEFPRCTFFLYLLRYRLTCAHELVDI